VKNLFEPSSAIEIKKRIELLRPGAERQWGAMNAAQMLAHCSAWMEWAAGLKTPPRSFAGRIVGKMAKNSVLGEAPIRRNMPTEKSLIAGRVLVLRQIADALIVRLDHVDLVLCHRDACAP
jgi:hypothetical protein